jgi:hypothetical protein
MRATKTTITRRRRRSWTSSPQATLLAFALLCIGVLLLSERTVQPAVRAAGQARREVLSEAIEATRHAERALDDENYGEARTHLAQARLGLERLMDHDSTERTKGDSE